MFIAQQDVDGFKCTVTYSPQTRHYTVAVEYKDKRREESFPACFDPVFGPDIIDQKQMGDIGEKLAQEIEKELGEEK